MKKLILPAMIAALSMAALTTRAQLKVAVRVGVPVRPLPVRPAVVVVRPAVRRRVVVVRPVRHVIVRRVAIY